MKPEAKLITVTPDAEEIIAYIARVSSPSNQNNPDASKLLKYLIRHGHWSPFEQAHMTLEVNLPLAIAVQILRHRSFCFQQFSQRYADATLLDGSIPLFELREQDHKNRQNSTDTISQELKEKYLERIRKHFADAISLYNEMLADNIAKECARFVLPMAIPTRIYITGNVRSWIHYLQARTKEEAQKEHRDAAAEMKKIFVEQFPNISKALEW